MRSTLSISLPTSMKDWVEAQAEVDGFDTAAEFIRSLIEARQSVIAARQKVDAELLRSLDSGPATPLTKADFETIKREGLRRVRATKAKAR